MPMVRSTTGEAGLRLADIDLFAVTVGPGAFTGLRIGLAAAAGMALAAGRPIIGIGNLEASVHAVPLGRSAGRTVLAALDSRRAELFAQPFDEVLKPLAEPACLAPADLPGLVPDGPVLVTGDAAGSPPTPFPTPARRRFRCSRRPGRSIRWSLRPWPPGAPTRPATTRRCRSIFGRRTRHRRRRRDRSRHSGHDRPFAAAGRTVRRRNPGGPACPVLLSRGRGGLGRARHGDAVGDARHLCVYCPGYGRSPGRI